MDSIQDSIEIKKIPVSELFFDYRNPRLVEFDEVNSQTPVEKIIKILWEAMDVREIVLSIAASGFFKNEFLIVSQESGRNIVIEGNRRLAAIKVILESGLINAPIPEVSEEIKKSLLEVPVMIATRKEAWRYLGFKHVNGPAKWGSYAKARYIAQVHNDFNIPIPQIALQIGDTHKTVQRLYRGLMVVEQAEKEKVFAREDARRSHFAFSHMYSGLQYKGISQLLNLRDENEDTTEFVPKNKINELRDLCLWLYGSKKADIEPVVQTQNPHLRQLDCVVQNKEALAALKNGDPLESALKWTQPASARFEDELLKAKRNLYSARGLATDGYDGSEHLLKIVESISDMAYDLYREMEGKRHRGPKRIIPVHFQ